MTARQRVRLWTALMAAAIVILAGSTALVWWVVLGARTDLDAARNDRNRFAADVLALRAQVERLGVVPVAPVPESDGAPVVAGPAGERGPVGERGRDGAAGPKGETGPVGPAGAQGERGGQGAQGGQGDVGPQGATGAQGEIGPMGPGGAEGPMGPQGPGPTDAQVQAAVDAYCAQPAHCVPAPVVVPLETTTTTGA